MKITLATLMMTSVMSAFGAETPPLASATVPLSATPAAAGTLKVEGAALPEKAVADSGGATRTVTEAEKATETVVHLPNYVVPGFRLHLLDERDLLTEKGKTEFGMKLHPGLRLVPFSFLNASIAREMAREDERLEAIADLTDTARAMIRGGDVTEGEYILKTTQEAYFSDRSSILDFSKKW